MAKKNNRRAAPVKKKQRKAEPSYWMAVAFIAMAFAVASLRASGAITIRDCSNVATSFPNFVELACGVGFNDSRPGYRSKHSAIGSQKSQRERRSRYKQKSGYPTHPSASWSHLFH